MNEVDILLFKQSNEFKEMCDEAKKESTRIVTFICKSKPTMLDYTLNTIGGTELAAIAFDQIVDSKIGEILQVKNTLQLMELLGGEVLKMVEQN